MTFAGNSHKASTRDRAPIPETEPLCRTSARLYGEEERNGDYAKLEPTGRRIINNCREFVQQNTGLLLVVVSQAFFCLMDAAVKKLHTMDPPVTTLQLMVIRMSVTFICCMIYAFVAGIPNPILGPKGVRLLLASRGIGGFFALFGIYFSLKYLSLSDATVLTFLAPTCTAIAGSMLLGETYTLRQALAGMVSLAGVILVARPTIIFQSDPRLLESDDQVTPQERVLAVGAALIGVLGSTMACVSIRAVGNTGKAHPMHSMVYFSMMCTVVSAIGMAVTQTAVVIPTQLDWLALLLMIGVFGFMGQLLITMGLQRETAGRGAMGGYTLIVFAIILEYVVFHTVPERLSMIGIFMIIVSALYVALTKEKGPTSTSKSKLDILPKFSEEDGLERGLLSHSTTQVSYNSCDRTNTAGR